MSIGDASISVTEQKRPDRTLGYVLLGIGAVVTVIGAVAKKRGGEMSGRSADRPVRSDLPSIACCEGPCRNCLSLDLSTFPDLPE